MAKRTVTDAEIGLIKAMLRRGMRNQDIQFYFNRPNRPVNSGRITGISNGTYSNAALIAAVSEQDLDQFLDEAKGNAQSAPSDAARLSRTDERAIKNMFSKDSDGTWHLSGGESDTAECKANFGFRHAHQWVKAIAGLANNRGGYLFFGVADAAAKGGGNADLSNLVVGMSNAEFSAADPADITNKLKSFLDPTPRIERAVHKVGQHSVGVIYVEQHPSRPVIATKADGDRIREGDIFFRYPGQTARIKYGDLRGLLDQRDAQSRLGILPLLEKVLELGPRRALLADLERGELNNGPNTIMIDPALVEQINFIREGSFDEVEGAPTLRLVGDVVITDTKGYVGSRGAITDEILLDKFVKREKAGHPVEYIRYAAGAGRAHWLPIRYFASQAKLSREGTISAIQTAQGTPIRKAMLARKIKNDRAAFRLFDGTPMALLEKINAGEIASPPDEKAAMNLAAAMCGLEHPLPVPEEKLLRMLAEVRKLMGEQPGHSGMTYYRRAACRLDEILFPFK